MTSIIFTRVNVSLFTCMFEESFIIKAANQSFKNIFLFSISSFLHLSHHKISITFRISSSNYDSTTKENIFRKETFRNDVHKNKKRKLNKKTIAKSIVQKSSRSSSKIISNEFSLSTIKTIIISDCTLSFIQQHDSRARQLLNELEKIRQQYQMKKMTKLTQSKRSTTNEIVFNEYDYDISKRTMQKVIFFISINV